jgi:hypothetical protein
MINLAGRRYRIALMTFGQPASSPDPAYEQQLFETFLVRDTGRKDRVGNGILEVHGGVKWGWQVQPA